jgi:hypothetical protein
MLRKLFDWIDADPLRASLYALCALVVAVGVTLMAVLP